MRRARTVYAFPASWAASATPAPHAVEFDLIVVAEGGKGGEFGDGAGEPARLVRQMDEAVLGRRRLRVQAHDLVSRQMAETLYGSARSRSLR